MTDASRDDDFYLWTRQQAAALRALAKKSRDNKIDWSGVIEEVEDMGKSERNALVSLLTQILLHAYKIENSRNPDPVSGWREEILNFQDACNQHMTPSLRRELGDWLDEIHRRACKRLRASFAVHDEPPPVLPDRNPYTIDDLLADDFALRPLPKPPGA
jgi:hypothetical protein